MLKIFILGRRFFFADIRARDEKKLSEKSILGRGRGDGQWHG